jgi:hypothetical protein
MQAGQQKSKCDPVSGWEFLHDDMVAYCRNKVYYGLPNRNTLILSLTLTLSLREREQQDGFVQVYIAKIQSQPAKMLSVMPCIVSSGEYGFGPDPPNIQFIGEKS